MAWEKHLQLTDTCRRPVLYRCEIHLHHCSNRGSGQGNVAYRFATPVSAAGANVLGFKRQIRIFRIYLPAASSTNIASTRGNVGGWWWWCEGQIH